MIDINKLRKRQDVSLCDLSEVSLKVYADLFSMVSSSSYKLGIRVQDHLFLFDEDQIESLEWACRHFDLDKDDAVALFKMLSTNIKLKHMGTDILNVYDIMSDEQDTQFFFNRYLSDDNCFSYHGVEYVFADDVLLGRHDSLSRVRRFLWDMYDKKQSKEILRKGTECVCSQILFKRR